MTEEEIREIEMANREHWYALHAWQSKCADFVDWLGSPPKGWSIKPHRVEQELKKLLAAKPKPPANRGAKT